jgi:hypothetical protein
MKETKPVKSNKRSKKVEESEDRTEADPEVREGKMQNECRIPCSEEQKKRAESR